jgi:hypothetical protein
VELTNYHHQGVQPSEAAISPQASTSIVLLSLLLTPLSVSQSRNGYVVIGGKGTDGQPLADVWVSPLRAFALT